MNPLNISNPLNIEEPFANTNFGIGVNTVLGLPRATLSIGKSILGFLNKEFPGVTQVVHGIKTGDWKPYISGFKGSPLSRLKDPKNVLDLTMGFIDPASGESKVLKTAIKDTLENFFIKETKPKVIKSVLEELGHPANAIEDAAKRLAKAKDAKAVQAILNPTPIDVLTSAIRESKPLRGEIEKLQTIERSKRFASASQAQSSVGGEQGYFAGLSKLKGALIEKLPEFTPPRSTLPKEGIDALFTAVQKNPVITFGEKLTGQKGLKKLLDGHVPVPSELKVLEEVFGSDVVKAIYDKRPLSEKIWNLAGEIVADLPRALKTTLDMSATLRQGALFTVRHPIRSTESFAKSFKSMLSNNYFEKALGEMKTSPEYLVAKDAGLRLSDPTKIFGDREEFFLSNLAEKIPVIGSIVKGSNRAYTGFLNNLRFTVFNDLAQSMSVLGEPSQKNLKSLADFVNTATGSGGLYSLEKHASLFNKVMFAPRYVMSRVQFMNPYWYAKQPQFVRKEALKTFGTFLGTVSSVISLVKLGGADVELDPRSSNFGKMKSGNTYFDLTAGFGQYVRLFSQLLTGEKITQSGNLQKFGDKGPYSETRADAVGRVLRGKLAPAWASLFNLAAGENVVGEPVTLSSELLDQVIPLYAGDLVDAINDRGAEALFQVGLPSFFGVQTNTFKEKITSNPLNL